MIQNGLLFPLRFESCNNSSFFKWANSFLMCTRLYSLSSSTGKFACIPLCFLIHFAALKSNLGSISHLGIRVARIF